ncbi:hypothetical protein VT91_24710 [Clostridium sporogenes]|uniref:hypothetical protein n=2 Tax=Clostridium botulinum TaxID=1491 RepID=UPI000717965A|nr:hypothetical protein [Clostridium botulinum]KRU25146.1 hypothetical protein WG71_31000 [Clostridium sporogenes]KRU28023.1 hypothetical protein VT91_24710 [Clostridium sporogenes]KRU28729.1 hypothetical protein VT28_20960 [Clostridium sporogenes]KRU44218.1 hypothetical protein VT95_14720 [Clostridium sporogenes]MBZ1329931.1 hypothetical protein [Clostridium botulinum]
MGAVTNIKKLIKVNANKKAYFVKWYVDSDKSRESFDKEIKKLCNCEHEYAMSEWLLDEDVQNAIKEYLKQQRQIKMMEMYDAMYQKAKNGDVKSAEWVEKFFKSDFFNDSADEIDDYLEGINIPALKGE